MNVELFLKIQFIKTLQQPDLLLNREGIKYLYENFYDNLLNKTLFDLLTLIVTDQNMYVCC